MRAPDPLLQELQQCGYTAWVEDGRLWLRGPGRPPADLEATIREHRAALIAAVEDEELERTGVIQSKRQVFDLARAYFGPEEHNAEGAA